MNAATSVNQAVILVGGEGTRLRPLTLHTPKSLVPILNTPFLFWMLKWLAGYGIIEVILSMGYLSSEFQEICSRFAKELNIKVIQVIEPKPLGTAGAIKFAEKYLTDRFLVFNGDIFTQFNLRTFIDAHYNSRSTLTIAVTSVDDPSRYGVVEHESLQDRCGRILRFLEKPSSDETESREINAGVYLMKREVLDIIKKDEAVSIEREIFPVLVSQDTPIFAYPLMDEYWIDIGTHDKYRQVHWDLLPKAESLLCADGGVGESGRWRKQAEGIVTLTDFNAQQFNFSSPIVIGKLVSIAGDAQIGPNVVLGDNVVIGNKCQIKNSILWNSCNIGDGAVLNGVVLADGCRIAPGITLQDTIIPAGEHVTL